MNARYFWLLAGALIMLLAVARESPAEENRQSLLHAMEEFRDEPHPFLVGHSFGHLDLKRLDVEIRNLVEIPGKNLSRSALAPLTFSSGYYVYLLSKANQIDIGSDVVPIKHALSVKHDAGKLSLLMWEVWEYFFQESGHWSVKLQAKIYQFDLLCNARIRFSRKTADFVAQDIAKILDSIPADEERYLLEAAMRLMGGLDLCRCPSHVKSGETMTAEFMGRHFGGKNIDELSDGEFKKFLQIAFKFGWDRVREHMARRLSDPRRKVACKYFPIYHPVYSAYPQSRTDFGTVLERLKRGGDGLTMRDAILKSFELGEHVKRHALYLQISEQMSDDATEEGTHAVLAMAWFAMMADPDHEAMLLDAVQREEVAPKKSLYAALGLLRMAVRSKSEEAWRRRVDAVRRPLRDLAMSNEISSDFQSFYLLRLCIEAIGLELGLEFPRIHESWDEDCGFLGWRKECRKEGGELLATWLTESVIPLSRKTLERTSDPSLFGTKQE